MTSIDDTLWLDLTLASTRQIPALRDTDHIAERSAHHPDKPAAAQLTALLVTHPRTDPWRDATVRQYARTLLAAIGQRPPNPQLAQPTRQLHRARWMYDERAIRAAGHPFAEMCVDLDDVIEGQLPPYRDVPERDPQEWGRPHGRRQLMQWMFGQARHKAEETRRCDGWCRILGCRHQRDQDPDAP
ncbi:hypothetical protein [Streptomyces sp. NPDC127190]|uniref:hypothetical protein n=1 Tax=unclassified Streptomyces TaxID=2593676 RepID=UPI003629B603